MEGPHENCMRLSSLALREMLLRLPLASGLHQVAEHVLHRPKHRHLAQAKGKTRRAEQAWPDIQTSRHPDRPKHDMAKWSPFVVSRLSSCGVSHCGNTKSVSKRQNHHLERKVSLPCQMPEVGPNQPYLGNNALTHEQDVLCRLLQLLSTLSCILHGTNAFTTSFCVPFPRTHSPATLAVFSCRQQTFPTDRCGVYLLLSRRCKI